MPPQKGVRQIYVNERVWDGLKFVAHSRYNKKISDYLDPLLAELLRLENAGLDPLAILKKAGKGGT